MALSPGGTPPSLTSPGTSVRRRKYQAFLSFRGEDTRMGFVSHLFNELERQGISIFKDDQVIEGGAPISTELLSAIEDSYLAVIVLSPNYASSSWCLDELAKIVQCMDSKDLILPVFYYVDPSDVRKQLGSFAKAFETHDKNFTSTEGKEKVNQWKANLTTVAGLSGWHLDGKKCERGIIEDIVKCVWRKVQTTLTLFNSPDELVERVSALNRLIELLAVGANDVRFVGITGMGGMGKTTLAHRVCDIVSHSFKVHCFLENVREVSAKDSTLLQNQLLFSIFNEKGVQFWDARHRCISIMEGLRNNKVLLVLDDLDDVSHLDQLQKLAGDKDRFGNGSRIIITTRNRRLLVQHDITLIYEVEGMSDGEALELFSLKAFKKVQPDEEFLGLSAHFLNHAKGVPLVLKVWGSSLYKRDRDAWKSVLDNLQNYPHRDVFDSLKISYDGLREEEKRIFLDIACFHKGRHKQQVIDILDKRFDNISSLIVIDILIERSLLTMLDHMHLEMHDLIQDMGREIVRWESKEEPGDRTRIWRLDDLRHVLMANTGTKKVEAIVVNSPKLVEIRCNSEAMSIMDGVRHIELNNVMTISSAPICPPRFSRIVRWSMYPFTFLPQGFHAHYLTELRMPKSKLVRLWDERKDFSNLKIMDLRCSVNLTSTPDFTGMPKLEELQFAACTNLVDIHPSIAVLKRLIYLDLQFCKSVECLHNELEMDSLKELNLWYCSKMKKVPEFSEQMKTLTLLTLRGSAIEQLPSSIGNLVGLRILKLRETGIKQLPSSIGNLVDLTSLDLNGSVIEQLPSSIGNLVGLIDLNLRDCNLGEGAIPEDIGCLSSLTSLDLRGNHFVTLPASIQCLSKLVYLGLDGCKSLLELPPLPPLPPRFLPLEVHVENCTSLQRLTDPSKLSSKFANLYDFNLYPLNCVRLVEDEGFINYVHSKIVRWITKDKDWLPLWVPLHKNTTDFTYPGREIPEWFVNKSEDTGDWLGIAFCFVCSPEIPDVKLSVTIKCSSGFVHCVDRHPGLEHVTMFYWRRKQCRKECSEAAEAEFSFETKYYDKASNNTKVGVNTVKKWAARWVYKKDLEDLQQRLKVLKRTHEYYGEETESPESPQTGSDAMSDDEEPNHKRQKEDRAALD